MDTFRKQTYITESKQAFCLFLKYEILIIFKVCRDHFTLNKYQLLITFQTIEDNTHIFNHYIYLSCYIYISHYIYLNPTWLESHFLSTSSVWYA